MAEKRRGLGRGIGALIPNNQQEKPNRPIDVFFSSSSQAAASDTPKKSLSEKAEKNTQKNVSRETSTAILVSQKEAQASTSEKSATPKKSAAKKVSAPSKGKSSAESNASAKLQASQGESSDNLELVPVPGATFGELDVTEIVPNTKQPRQVFDEDDLQELSDSIKEVGVLQPIVVRPLAQPLPDNPQARYELIMGERRWRATQRAGLTTIPAIVRHTEDSDLLRDALLENLHRIQLNVLEEAAAYQQLLDDFQITQEQLSKKIARSRPQISNTLRLLKLPPLVQRRVAAGVLSAGHARALLGLSDAAAMERLAQRIVAEGLSVRSVEEIVALGGEETKKERASRTYLYKDELDSLASRLADLLDTRVKVQMGSKKGRISIDFAGIEDLNRILSIVGSEYVDIEG